MVQAVTARDAVQGSTRTRAPLLRARALTAERVSDSIARKWAGSSMTEMYTWTFGVPHGIELGDSSVLITFYATQGDDRIHQRFARIKVE